MSDGNAISRLDRVHWSIWLIAAVLSILAFWASPFVGVAFAAVLLAAALLTGSRRWVPLAAMVVALQLVAAAVTMPVSSILR